MKYNNNPPKPPGKAEILHLIQQFGISADKMREMLYFVQDFVQDSRKLVKSPGLQQKADESRTSCGNRRTRTQGGTSALSHKLLDVTPEAHIFTR